ncbi:MAG: hypothetical protein WBM07_10960 [Chitinivibrionales bacterium]
MRIFLWCFFFAGLSLFEVGTMLRDHSQDARLNKLEAAITCVQQPQERHYFKYMEYKIRDLPAQIKADPISAYYTVKNDSLYIFIVK